jgi:flavin-dependent dehydrogenase
VLGLDLGGYPGGYGWLFPKATHVNIGVGVWHHLGPSLRERLNRLTRTYGFDPAALRDLRGHALPARRPDAPLVDGRILLVGDAAGLLDPLSGEGIYSAVWSGRAAASHLAAYLSDEAPDLRGYQHEVERMLAPELRTARRWLDIAQVAPALATIMLRRSPRVWADLCGLVRGEQTYQSLLERLGPLAIAVDLASDLVRASARVQRWVEMQDAPPPERFLAR